MLRIELANREPAGILLAHQGEYDLVLGDGQYASEASRVATRIENYIHASGWPVGAIIGPESALQDHFRVNRPVLRQAITILTGRGVGHMKAGRGGGLVVEAPDADTVARTIAHYMRWNGVTRTQAAAACEIVARSGPTIAPQTLSLQWLAAFDALDRTLTPEADGVAMIARGPDFPLGRETSAAIAARRLLDEIVARDDDGGSRLGSTFDLAERLDVTPRVAISAVRLLEEIGMVETRRGRSGGLVVGRPKQYPMARLAHGLMLARRVPETESHAFVWRLNVAHAAIAATERSGLDVLEPQMERLRAANASRLRMEWTRLQRELGNAAGNPALDMLARCFASFNIRLDLQAWQTPPVAIQHQLKHESEAVVRAVRAGDPARAVAAQTRCHAIVNSLDHSPRGGRICN